jgi:hypothetical protein
VRLGRSDREVPEALLVLLALPVKGDLKAPKENKALRVKGETP